MEGLRGRRALTPAPEDLRGDGAHHKKLRVKAASVLMQVSGSDFALYFDLNVVSFQGYELDGKGRQFRPIGSSNTKTLKSKRSS